MPISDSCLRNRFGAAFSLIEMLVVIAVLGILLTVGVGFVSGTGAQSRKVSTDVLTGLIERARVEAITSRSHVLLALATPGDLDVSDKLCRVGLFQVDEWPEEGSTQVEGVLLTRWRELKQGVGLIGGEVDGLANPLDSEEITVNYTGGGVEQSIDVHALVIHSRGGLEYPSGSQPVVFRLAEVRYQDDEAVPLKRGGSGRVLENRLRVGRVIARSYQFD